VLIFGSAGMAGHMIFSYFDSLKKYDIINVDRNEFNEDTIVIDITNKAQVETLLRREKPDIVINCIGLLVKNSNEHPDQAVYINSYFPHQLAKLGLENSFKLVHMSTDCVFSGKSGNYSENSIKDGKDMYARSKALGEIDNDKDLTFRMSIIGPEIRANGTGLFEWFMKQTDSVNGYKNVYWTGVTTLELAKAMDRAIDHDLKGLYHLVPQKNISKFELLHLFKQIWKKEITILEDTSQKHNKSLLNNRIDFKFEVGTYYNQLFDLKLWMSKANLYPTYD